LNSWLESRIEVQVEEDGQQDAHQRQAGPNDGRRSCIVCLAIPGKIIEIDAINPQQAVVDVVGVRRKVDLGLLQDDRPVPGDWVLIHVGFAMSKISEADAADQMRTLHLLGEADAAMQEVRGYGLENEEQPQPRQRRAP
jgi:hydrogenase expression/formation protein HypC